MKNVSEEMQSLIGFGVMVFLIYAGIALMSWAGGGK